MEANIKHERINSLQALRAIAFLSVFIFHANRSFLGDGVLYDSFIKSLGRWGVSVFFVLSGFVMTYAYWDRPPKENIKGAFFFSIRKIQKLYPLHLIMLFMGSVYMLLKHETLLGILKRLAITIPLLQTWFPVEYMAINSVAWYLSACVFLYFGFPYLLKLIKKRNSRIRSIVAMLIIFTVQLIIGFLFFHHTQIDIKWITYCHPLFRFGDFAIGGFLASLYLYKKDRTVSNHSSAFLSSVLEVLAVALTIMVCIFYTKTTSNSYWFSYTCLFTPSTVLLIYVFSLNKGIVSRLLTNRSVLWIAFISPYAFLIHRLVISYFHAFTVQALHLQNFNFIVAVLISFGLTVLATYLFLALEKKVRSLFKGRKAKTR